MQLFIQFLREQWILWAALAVVVVIYVITEMLSKARGPKLLSSDELTALMNSETASVVDVRAQNKFTEGHILGATSMNESDINTEKLQKYQGKSLVLVCDNGVKSLMLARKLKTQGVSEIGVLIGGMQAWRGAGMPAVKGKN